VLTQSVRPARSASLEPATAYVYHDLTVLSSAYILEISTMYKWERSFDRDNP
jgi:hypothetical protein